MRRTLNRLPDKEDTMTEAQILYDRHVCARISELRFEQVDEDGEVAQIGVCTISGEEVIADQCTGLPCSKVMEEIE
jgi:hypothetical protein